MKKYLICSLLLSFQSTYAYNLPNIGSASGGTLSSVAEADLGKTFIQMVKSQLPLLEDPIAGHYIQSLGNALVKNSNMPKQHFHFFIVKDGEINAFSGPGGYIGVNTGLILTARNEGELAAVMSHEIAHVTQRHLARMIGEQKNHRLGNVAAVAAAIALGASGNGEAAAGLATAATAGNIQQGLNYSRGYEKEADEVGMQTLAKSGYSPYYMPRFFERMQGEAKLNNEDVPEILLTHPLTASRIAEAENRAALISISHPKKDNPLFYLIQARILVETSSDPRNLVDNLKSQLDRQSKPASTLQYAYALALIRTGNLKTATTVLDGLIKKQPEQSLFIIAKAHALQLESEPLKARQLLEGCYKKNRNYETLVSYARLLLLNNQNQAALDLLHPEQNQLNQDPYYLHLLSEAQGKSGKISEAYQTRAKLLLLNHQPDAAILQLEQGLKFTKDVYQRAKIEREIQQIKLAE